MIKTKELVDQKIQNLVKKDNVVDADFEDVKEDKEKSA